MPEHPHWTLSFKHLVVTLLCFARQRGMLWSAIWKVRFNLYTLWTIPKQSLLRSYKDPTKTGVETSCKASYTQHFLRTHWKSQRLCRPLLLEWNLLKPSQISSRHLYNRRMLASWCNSLQRTSKDPPPWRRSFGYTHACALTGSAAVACAARWPCQGFLSADNLYHWELWRR